MSETKRKWWTLMGHFVIAWMLINSGVQYGDTSLHIAATSVALFGLGRLMADITLEDQRYV